MKTVNAVVGVVLEVWVTVALTRRTWLIELEVSRTTIVLISAKRVASFLSKFAVPLGYDCGVVVTSTIVCLIWQLLTVFCVWKLTRTASLCSHGARTFRLHPITSTKVVAIKAVQMKATIKFTDPEFMYGNVSSEYRPFHILWDLTFSRRWASRLWFSEM